MWGLYVHVPFCVTRCIYCDFYSQQDLSQQEAYIESLIRELEFYHSLSVWQSPPNTLYLGGGTPSSLFPSLLQRLMGQIHSLWPDAKLRECTLEANPEDITPEWIMQIRTLGFNRVSVGVQSLDDKALRFLNRRHSASTARHALNLLAEMGVEEINADLIFALPSHLSDTWSSSLEQILQLPISHLSAYGLTYEPGTQIAHLSQTGCIKPCSDEVYINQYYSIIEACSARGWVHYELSNWSRPGSFARHNSAYWQGIPYLGVGPSAHSYDGDVRWNNIASLSEYIARSQRGESLIETRERLTQKERHNETVMLQLRTYQGIDLSSPDINCEWLRNEAQIFEKQGLLTYSSEGRLILTHEGLILADEIMSSLFL